MLSAVLGIVGVVGILASVLGVWVHRVAFEPTSVAEAVDAALRDPEVTGSLADHLAIEIVEVISLEQLLDERLPSVLEPVRPVVVDGARRVVAEQVERVLEDDRVRAAVVDAAEVAHRRAAHVLEGGSLLDGSVASIGDDAVTIDLLPLVARALVEVQERTGLLGSVDVPELERGGDPEEHRRLLSDALGRDLPGDFGQLQVYRASAIVEAGASVARAQHAVIVVRRSLAVLVVVTVAAIAGSVALARRRIRAAALLVGGVVAMAAIGRALVRSVVADAAAMVSDPGAVRAVRVMGESLTAGLVTVFRVAAVLALVLVVAAVVVRRPVPAADHRASGEV